MANNNRNCICCGNEYEYCSSCDVKLPTWMSLYHNKNCKDLFDITSDYLAQIITKEDAAEKYKECDLTNFDKFEKSIQNSIKEVGVVREERKEKVVANEVINSEKATSKKAFKSYK